MGCEREILPEAKKVLRNAFMHTNYVRIHPVGLLRRSWKLEAVEMGRGTSGVGVKGGFPERTQAIPYPRLVGGAVEAPQK